MTYTPKKLISKLQEKATYKNLPSKVIWYLKRKYHEKILFKIASNESIFTSIWQNNYWGDKESVSGPGSTLEYTASVRKSLPIMFEKFEIRVVFDAPCGDFNWMSEVVKNTGITYLGGDIVEGIIENNKAKNNEKVNFRVFDISKNVFPKVDLWICRDVLFHLSFRDILKSFQQFSKSDIQYLLVTTHLNKKNFSNSDISSGDFRLIDLFQPPFNLRSSEVLYRFEDYIEPHHPREMCLFTREQIKEILPYLEKEIQ